MRQTEVRPGPGDRVVGLAAAARARRSTFAKVVLGVGAVLLLSACSAESAQSALDPAGPYAQRPHDLIRIVFILALGVFIFVQGLIVYSVVKFRRRADDDGSLPVQVHGNTRLEIIWTVIPALILAAIAVPTVQGIFAQMDEPDDPETVTIQVIGHRWWWEYEYPAEAFGLDESIFTANELVIPAGVPVRLEMTAADNQRSPDRGVIHSFWIPRLGGKQDVVPGQTTFLNLQADDPGTYIGQCAEYCGLSHVNMRARAIALDEAEWQQWLEDQSSPAAEPEGGLEAEGRGLFEELGPGPDGADRQACIQCHQVYTEGGARSAGQGPDLTHLFSRSEFAGAIQDLDEDNLRAWLADPNAVKPMQWESNGIGMPNLDLSEDEIDALVAYLMTLQ
ncbi:MAG: cytochrome c oxidase subunit II [Nitriliruptor sp.]|uniref:cytochrome c oxidase subunit II n=1 Tax=Nitriliruptor sp. TaxID=2448056 RepID=UPI0034A010AD